MNLMYHTKHQSALEVCFSVGWAQSFKPTDYFFVTFFDPPLNCVRSREERRFLSYRITPSCT